MSIVIERPTDANGLWDVLRQELARHPGRAAAVVRISAGCTLTVALAMVYEIPLPAYMAYCVFLIMRRDVAGTLTGALGGAIAATLAVGLSLALYAIDLSEPALRLPAMAAATFLGMFMARTLTIGPIAFLAAFVLVLSQTLADQLPSPELLTRLVLWLWVVALIPIGISVLIDALFGETPAALARRLASSLLAAITEALEGRGASPLERDEAEALTLIELRGHAQLLNRNLQDYEALDARLMERLVELLYLVRALPPGTPIEVLEVLARASAACECAYAQQDPREPVSIALPELTQHELSGDVLAVGLAITHSLQQLRSDIAARCGPADTIARRSASSAFVSDAFSNPDHVRFALKTTIAVMCAYIAYSIADWPGIRTAVTTCFFVALSSLGETMHKLTLRIVGALIGAAAAGLSIIYLLPHLTDIGQLSLLIAGVSALSAWVATSSERLGYAGFQMAFAFFLGVLHDYGPATDLTVLRDRVVGILVGNVLISIVFSTLWPVSALDRARAAMSEAMRSLGTLLSASNPLQVGARLKAVQNLLELRRLRSLATFELSMLPMQREAHSLHLVALLQRLITAAFVVAAQPAGRLQSSGTGSSVGSTAKWFADAAERIRHGEPYPACRSEVGEPQSVLPHFEYQSPIARADRTSRRMLDAEIEHVVSMQQ